MMATNNRSKLKIKCSNKHSFLLSFAKLKQGKWCKFCAKNDRKMIHASKQLEEANAIAVSRDGQCLSHKYIGAYDHLRWKCNLCGCIWKASLSYTKVKKNGAQIVRKTSYTKWYIVI